jgi:site-specific DNA recombinase
MVAELIDHIEVYHAEKQDGITNQRVTIHYNCIGAFEVTDRRKIPEADIIMETRKDVALSYAPERLAV